MNASGAVLRVGFQKSGAFFFLRNEGSLEKAVAPLGYTVEWKEFSAGPPLIEALNAGSIDLGHSGECPLVLAQAAGVPLRYIGNSDADPDSVAIVVPGNSRIQAVADLRGRKVAFDKGTSSHYLVARALEQAGLGFADIQPVYLGPPNARAAFQSGAVAAWCIWDPFFAAAELDSGAKVLVSGKGLSPHREFYFARAEFAEKNPAAVAALLKALNESGSRLLKDREGSVKLLAEKTGVKLEILRRAQGRYNRYNARPLNKEVIAEQQDVADFLFKQGIIPKPVQVSDVVYHPPETPAVAVAPR